VQSASRIHSASAGPGLGAEFSGSLLRSALIQLRVIHALVLREVITRYGRHNIGFAWLFLEPMLFTCGVATLWTMTKMTHGSNLPIVAFALTGYSSILLWRNCSSRCVKAIEPNLCLMFHRNVTALDVLLSRIVLEVLGASVSLTVLSLVFVSLGWMAPPGNILMALYGWGMLAWFALSLSLLVGALSERSELLDRVWHIVTYLLFPLSGAGYLVEWLPVSAQKAMLWLPMVHGVEMLRSGYFGGLMHPQYDAGYLAVANLILMLLGLSVTRRLSQHLQPA
jgi:capsular polysaccharide transport system permease protein